jgi:hypothetical protein
MPVASLRGEGSAENLGGEGIAGNFGGVGSLGKLREGGPRNSGGEGIAAKGTAHAEDVVADLASEELSSTSLNEDWEAAVDLVSSREDSNLELAQNVTESDVDVRPTFVEDCAIEQISDRGEERNAATERNSRKIEEPSAMGAVNSWFGEALGAAEGNLVIDEDGKAVLQSPGDMEKPGSETTTPESRVETEEEGEEGWSREGTGSLEEGPGGRNAGASTSASPGSIPGEGGTVR